MDPVRRPSFRLDPFQMARALMRVRSTTHTSVPHEHEAAPPTPSTGARGPATGTEAP